MLAATRVQSSVLYSLLTKPGPSATAISAKTQPSCRMLKRYWRQYVRLLKHSTVSQWEASLEDAGPTTFGGLTALRTSSTLGLSGSTITTESVRRPRGAGSR